MRHRERFAAALVAALVLSAAVPAAAGASAAPAVGGATAPAATASASLQEDCSFPVTRTDATGTEVTVESDPARVVVLGPSTAQTMWELNASGEVVGMPVAYYTTYLANASNKTNVLNQDFTTNVERVVALDPDVVLAPNITPNATVERLREAGLTVFKFGFGRSLDDIYAKTELTGRLTGHCGAAERTVAEMRDRVEAIRAEAETFEHPRVLYLIGNYTAGRGTFIGNAIETAGGVNVAAEANISGYRPLNEEQVLALNPEVIVVPSDGPPIPRKPGYNQTFAVRNGQVVTVDGNYISQPAPRVVIAMETMQEAFANAELEGTATPTETPTPTSTPTPSPTATPVPDDQGDDTQQTPAGDGASGGGPGFGVPAVLAALAALALLARRQ